jgi:hypothetical protein
MAGKRLWNRRQTMHSMGSKVSPALSDLLSPASHACTGIPIFGQVNRIAAIGANSHGIHGLL